MRIGKGEVEIPAREMLADILLESGHPEQALAEYERAMTIDPNRFNELYGAARSAELTKQTAKADKYYAQLVKNCSGSGRVRVRSWRGRRNSWRGRRWWGASRFMGRAKSIPGKCEPFGSVQGRP